MSEPKLTAAICFANEGEEVENTVRGIRETCGDAVDILLINDASTDGRDYESVADAYECRYLVNTEQIGPAHSRHKGLRLAKTENVILLDAHMRFYAQDWHDGVNEAIDKSPRSLFCTRSKPLKTGGVYAGGPVGMGASLQVFGPDFNASLRPNWNIKELDDSGLSPVPCVLGGCYAFRRDFMLNIGGYKSLHRYGGEEPLISVKAWLAGDGCKLINDVEIGHIYRDEKGAPWKDSIKFSHFNKLATARVLMGDPDFERILAQTNNLPQGDAARRVYRSRELFVQQAKAEFDRVRTKSLDHFIDVNQAFLDERSKQ